MSGSITPTLEWAGLRTADEVESILDLLEAMGWLRSIDVRPTTKLFPGRGAGGGEVSGSAAAAPPGGGNRYAIAPPGRGSSRSGGRLAGHGRGAPRVTPTTAAPCRDNVGCVQPATSIEPTGDEASDRVPENRARRQPAATSAIS